MCCLWHCLVAESCGMSFLWSFFFYIKTGKRNWKAYCWLHCWTYCSTWSAYGSCWRYSVYYNYAFCGHASATFLQSYPFCVVWLIKEYKNLYFFSKPPKIFSSFSSKYSFNAVYRLAFNLCNLSLYLQP